MSPAAGYLTTIKGQGASVAAVAEATTNLGGNVFQITSAAHRIIDPGVAVVVKDAGVPVAATAYTLDYLYGKVSGYAPGGAVTLDYSYVPVNAIADLRQVQFSCSRNSLDRTTFSSNGGARQRLMGLKDLKGSFKGLGLITDDQDPNTGGVQPLGGPSGVFEAGSVYLLEIQPGGAGTFFRAWVMLESWDEDASFDGLVEESINFVGCSRQGLNRTDGAVFGFGA